MEYVKTIFLRIPIAVLFVAWIFNELDIEGTNNIIFGSIVIGLTIIITFLFNHSISSIRLFPKLEDIDTTTPEEKNQIRKVQLFNISNINQEYEAFGMIEAYNTNKDQAKENLQRKAYELGANAVINVTTNIDNNVTGHVGSVATIHRMVSGTTSTITTYHYEGTAVKLLNIQKGQIGT